MSSIDKAVTLLQAWIRGFLVRKLLACTYLQFDKVILQIEDEIKQLEPTYRSIRRSGRIMDECYGHRLFETSREQPTKASGTSSTGSCDCIEGIGLDQMADSAGRASLQEGAISIPELILFSTAQPDVPQGMVSDTITSRIHRESVSHSGLKALVDEAIWLENAILSRIEVLRPGKLISSG